MLGLICYSNCFCGIFLDNNDYLGLLAFVRQNRIGNLSNFRTIFLIQRNRRQFLKFLLDLKISILISTWLSFFLSSWYISAVCPKIVLSFNSVLFSLTIHKIFELSDFTPEPPLNQIWLDYLEMARGNSGLMNAVLFITFTLCKWGKNVHSLWAKWINEIWKIITIMCSHSTKI